MSRPSLTGLDKKRLRLWLALFFLALAIPTAVLIQQAYSQLKWEAFHQHQLLAEELAGRIDRHLGTLVESEEARPFADYAFLNVAGDPTANFLQRSPLSNYPVTSNIPGLVGWFQVDPDGTFSTPLLPPPGSDEDNYGISPAEQKARLALQSRIQQLLSQNRLAQAKGAAIAGSKPVMENELREADKAAIAGAPAPATKSKADLELSDSSMPQMAEQTVAQEVFDQLKTTSALQEKEQKQKAEGFALGRTKDLKLDYSYQQQAEEQIQAQAAPSETPITKKRAARKELSALPEPQAPVAKALGAAETLARGQAPISTFESEIDPLEFGLLDSGHFVLFRKVWRNGQRYIQGMLIEQQPFLQGVMESTFRETALSQMSDLIIAYEGNVFSAFRGQSSQRYASSTEELSGALLYQTRLSVPLSTLELIFSIKRLPAGPGASVIALVTAILALVLCGGFYLMYRLGAKQIDLARQQQDFVSAVSHELKTPLTSIRMYGEMLREGWATEEKKDTYYDYIYAESERLSRLISNVLQLARMTRNDLRVDLKPLTVAELMDGIRSKVSSQIERAGFRLNLNCDETARQTAINIDADFFSQITINLVDNAIKFSANAEHKTIDISCTLLRDNKLQFSVRDYGPGIARDQIKKIFKLFYRSENELTRETVGTGIGLALVKQLAAAMDGQVDVLNCEPGTEFRVIFPIYKTS